MISTHSSLFPQHLPAIEGLNIISILPAASRSQYESYILIGAHYDTVPLSQGVNDNGSGMSCLLEVARLLTANRCKLKSNIIFAAFDLEEYVSHYCYYFIYLFHAFAIATHQCRRKMQSFFVHFSFRMFNYIVGLLVGVGY